MPSASKVERCSAYDTEQGSASQVPAADQAWKRGQSGLERRWRARNRGRPGRETPPALGLEARHKALRAGDFRPYEGMSLLRWDSADAHFRRVVWTASLSLAATPLMGLPIFPSNHVALILPFILILALVWERWPRYRTLRIGLLFLMVLLIPFGLYYRVVTVYDPLVIDLISTLPPLAAILGLYWMRWWVLRSPRTLFDRTGD